MPTELSSILDRFWEEPGGHIVLDDNLHIVDVGPEYLRMTVSQRDDIVGKEYINTITEPNPKRHAQAVDTIRRLTAAALKTKQTQKYPTVRSDIKSSIDGSIQERWWRGAYIPITATIDDEEKTLIVHRIEDVTTENVLLNQFNKKINNQRRSNYILYVLVIALLGVCLWFFTIRSNDNRTLALKTCNQVQNINKRISDVIKKEDENITKTGTAAHKFYQNNPDLLASTLQLDAQTLKTFQVKKCSA